MDNDDLNSFIEYSQNGMKGLSQALLRTLPNSVVRSLKCASCEAEMIVIDYTVEDQTKAVDLRVIPCHCKVNVVRVV